MVLETTALDRSATDAVLPVRTIFKFYQLANLVHLGTSYVPGTSELRYHLSRQLLGDYTTVLASRIIDKM